MESRKNILMLKLACLPTHIRYSFVTISYYCENCGYRFTDTRERWTSNDLLNAIEEHTGTRMTVEEIITQARLYDWNSLQQEPYTVQLPPPHLLLRKLWGIPIQPQWCRARTGSGKTLWGIHRSSRDCGIHHRRSRSNASWLRSNTWRQHGYHRDSMQDTTPQAEQQCTHECNLRLYQLS